MGCLFWSLTQPSLLASFESVVNADLSHVLDPDSPHPSRALGTSLLLPVFLPCLLPLPSLSLDLIWCRGLQLLPPVRLPFSEPSPSLSMRVSKHLKGSSAWENPKIPRSANSVCQK